jgi:hypothetical protein
MFRTIALSTALTVIATASWSQETCAPGASSNCALFLKGAFLVHAVDDTRFLIGVDLERDASKRDGRVDHLFLLSGVGLPSGWLDGDEVSGLIWIDPEGKSISLKSKGQHPRILSLEGVTWSHYWGYGTSGPKLAALVNARRSETCGHQPDSCWHVDGVSIDFPG